jgi:hypothetical protein
MKKQAGAPRLRSIPDLQSGEFGDRLFHAGEFALKRGLISRPTAQQRFE